MNSNLFKADEKGRMDCDARRVMAMVDLWEQSHDDTHGVHSSKTVRHVRFAPTGTDQFFSGVVAIRRGKSGDHHYVVQSVDMADLPLLRSTLQAANASTGEDTPALEFVLCFDAYGQALTAHNRLRQFWAGFHDTPPDAPPDLIFAVPPALTFTAGTSKTWTVSLGLFGEGLPGFAAKLWVRNAIKVIQVAGMSGSS